MHSGDSACVLPPHSLGRDMLDEIRRATEGLAQGARRRRAGERPVRRRRRAPARHRGEPARVADRAVRVQGDRRAARQDGLPAHARRAPRRPRPAGRADGRRSRLGEGGRPAVRPLRRLRRRARARDALHRRGHGHRARTSRRRSRRRRPPPGRTLPTEGTVFITVTDSDKPGAGRPRGALQRPRLPDRGDARDRGRDPRHGGAGRRGAAQDRRRARRTWSTASRAARSTWSSTRRPAPARATDGWEIRRAAVARGIPCITTLAGGMAAARAIAAGRMREPGVLSLQEIHRERLGV